MSRAQDFPVSVQKAALRRQGFRCGLCGARIDALGKDGQLSNEFGEAGQAHHVLHVKFGGTKDLANCVVICSSCHFCVYEGGNYRHGIVQGAAQDFPYWDGAEAEKSPLR